MTWIIKSLVFDFVYDLGYFTRAKLLFALVTLSHAIIRPLFLCPSAPTFM
jgi:hypothetical protein